MLYVLPYICYLWKQKSILKETKFIYNLWSTATNLTQQKCIVTVISQQRTPWISHFSHHGNIMANSNPWNTIYIHYISDTTYLHSSLQIFIFMFQLINLTPQSCNHPVLRSSRSLASCALSDHFCFACRPRGHSSGCWKTVLYVKSLKWSYAKHAWWPTIIQPQKSWCFTTFIPVLKSQVLTIWWSKNDIS